MSGDFWIGLLDITLFVWLISFTLAFWFNDLQSIVVFGFLAVFTQQMIIEHRIKEE